MCCGRWSGNKRWLWGIAGPVRVAAPIAALIGAIGLSKHATDKCSFPSRFATAAAAGEIFFPQRSALKLDNHECSPAILNKVVTAGGEFSSFARAANMLEVLADVTISPMQVLRLTQEVGQELAAARDEAARRHQRRELPSSADSPVPIACVEMDGGRMRTRAEGHSTGVFDPQWKETKVACLWRMEGEDFEDDPHPEPPKCFTDATRVQRLVRQIKNSGSPHEDRPKEPAPAEPGPARHRRKRKERLWPPKRIFRTCVASMRDVHEFGPLVAAEAQRRGFYEAGRQVFLGDGDHKNWTVQKVHFPHFTPVTDFVHVVSYVYQAAGAVTSSFAAQWEQYQAWLRDCWQGRTSQVVRELQQWQERLGIVKVSELEDLDEADPRRIVSRTLTYLENNQDRMRYPEYRSRGLPVTSSLVESLIKQFNQRVKGTEKFWTRPEKAEAILQVRAALLSDDDRLRTHIVNRPGRSTRRRPSSPSSQK